MIERIRDKQFIVAAGWKPLPAWVLKGVPAIARDQEVFTVPFGLYKQTRFLITLRKAPSTTQKSGARILFPPDLSHCQLLRALLDSFQEKHNGETQLG
jgi:hypothetical protein